MISALLFHCIEMYDLPFSFLDLIYLNLLRKKTLINFCSPLKKVFFFFFLNLKFGI